MAEFVEGDRVEVINHADKRHEGKHGEVMRVLRGSGPTTPNLLEGQKLPRPKTEPRFTMRLDDGMLLRNLRQAQIRKLEKTVIVCQVYNSVLFI